MNLLQSKWLSVCSRTGIDVISPSHIGDPRFKDLFAPRPDFLGALYQLLIGLLQVSLPPADVDEWRERWHAPPTVDKLEAAFEPYSHAFLLENGGPAFLQDFDLPAEAQQLPVADLLIDAGSDSNRFFNKSSPDGGMCESCFVQALLALQLNAPAGGRGVRTSVRGGGPLTTLLVPADSEATLWQRLWLNVLPADALGYPAVKSPADVLPWLTPTRSSDGVGAQETMPQLDRRRQPHEVHPLQAYWSMPRRIRLDAGTADSGDCAVCGVSGVRVIRHYRSRHGGTNYTGNWLHPLTPYDIDPKGEKPPISCKGYRAARGYRDWLGLVLGKEDHRPDAAGVVRHFNSHVMQPAVRLWCFGYSMSNMKALAWYESMLSVHQVAPDVLKPFSIAVKEHLDLAEETANLLRRQVRAALFRRPSEAGFEPAVEQGFWQRSESDFYSQLRQLSKLDFTHDEELLKILRRWLLINRGLALELFDQWVQSVPEDNRRTDSGVIAARAELEKWLSLGKAARALWRRVLQDLDPSESTPRARSTRRKHEGEKADFERRATAMGTRMVDGATTARAR